MYNLYESEVFNLLRNNLAILLTERQLRISDVSKNTGISRTTLTALYSNKSKMIQMETVNKLCQALHISPVDFFEYVNFDFDYSFDQGKLISNSDLKNNQTLSYESSLLININENNQHIDTIKLEGHTIIHYDGLHHPAMAQINLHVSNNTQLKSLQSYLQKMSTAFIENIKVHIMGIVDTSIKNSIKNEKDETHKKFVFLTFTSVNFDETNDQYQTKIKNRQMDSLHISPTDK